MSAPADLEGLPWPDGEPGPLRSAASALHGLAGRFDGTTGQLAGAAPADWTGSASVSYAGTLSRGGAALGQLAGALTEAAGALDRLATTIHDAQDDVRRAAAKLHAARQAAATARKRATAARAEADQARNAALFSPAPLMPGDPLQTAADEADGRAAIAESAAATAEGDAQRVQTWAQGVADDAVRRVHQADTQAAAVLEGGGTAPGLPVGGAAHASAVAAVWDFVYDVGIKPLNPFGQDTAGQNATVAGTWDAGILFGTAEWTSRYAAKQWMKTEPGQWLREPRWVAPYTRSTPSGGTTQVSGYVRKGVWQDSREVPDMATRAQWAERASRFGKAGTAAAFITAGVGQYFGDAGNPNLDTSARAGRIAMQTATVGTASAVGAWGGAAGGAAIGTAICPGPGTVIGGVVGGIVGSGVAGGIVDHFNDGVVDWAGHAADDVADGVKDFTSGAEHTAGKVFHALGL
jgi:uncharacterized protein YukE